MVKPNFKYFAKPPEFQKSRSVCQMLPDLPGRSDCAGINCPVFRQGYLQKPGKNNGRFCMKRPYVEVH
jgi:hypothetical protein